MIRRRRISIGHQYNNNNNNNDRRNKNYHDDPMLSRLSSKSTTTILFRIIESLCSGTNNRPKTMQQLTCIVLAIITISAATTRWTNHIILPVSLVEAFVVKESFVITNRQTAATTTRTFPYRNHNVINIINRFPTLSSSHLTLSLSPKPPIIHYKSRRSLVDPRYGSAVRRWTGEPYPSTTITTPLFHVTATTSSSISDDDNDDYSNTNNSINIREQKVQRIKEFFRIAVPAFIQLAAEPLAGLVDTAYLGRLGPAVLGGAGVAVSAQYAVGKLYNDPLLRTSISLVAAQDGKLQRNKRNQQQSSTSSDNCKDNETKVTNELSVAVSTALLLAFTVGFIQMLVYTFGCTTITQMMGLNPTNEMWNSCIGYLRIRAIGTPAATLWLVANGIFRGLGDTSTPLVYSLAFTALNAILDPIFIFTFGWGAAGAAAGTALAQYIALLPLLVALHKKVPIRIWEQFHQLGPTLKQYLQAGGIVLFRTIGKVMAYSVCARQAALLGSISAAAYNLTFQLGFATTQICEAVAVSVQTLLARELSAAEQEEKAGSKSIEQRGQIVRFLMNTSLIMGGGVATVLSAITYWRRNWIVKGLSSNLEVQNACLAVFPIVLLTQILKGSAYPVNGILMGGLDWTYSMITMWLSNFVCIGLIQYWLLTGTNAAIGAVSLQQLWIALAAFMGTQVVTGVIRYESKTGVWRILRQAKS